MKNRETRRSVLIAAQMKSSGPQCDVSIRNVSSRGLMREAQVPPARGSYIEISRPGLSIVGQVVWSSDRTCGIRTRDVISVANASGAPRLAAIALDDFAKPRRGCIRKSSEWKDRSRAWARTLQYVLLGLFAAAVGMTLAVTAYQTFSTTMLAIAKNL